jgi:hypothetical protein
MTGKRLRFENGDATEDTECEHELPWPESVEYGRCPFCGAWL